MARLLLVEDDFDLGGALVRALSQEKYNVTWVRRLQEAQAHLIAGKFECVVLDINLPDGEGFTLLAELREKKKDIPVIMMTAREALNDRLRAFSKGADDYVIKPFAIAELSARIAAVIRRAAGFSEKIWKLGDIEFDSSQHAARLDGKLLCLTPLEYALLEKLIRAAERVVTRRIIHESLWSIHETPSDASIEVLVHGLRKKLGQTQIKTVRGVGYMLSAV